MNHKDPKLTKIVDEEWKEIPGTDGRYLISNYGRIKSFAIYKTHGKILNCSLVNGFKIVQIFTKSFSRKFYVHKLVAENWLSKPSDKHVFVTHLDGNLKNNHVSNLEWHTKESLMEKHREMISQNPSLLKRTRAQKVGKLKESDVMLLKSMLERGVVQAKIAKLFCISEMQVTRIKRGENWGHVEARKPGKLMNY